MKFYKRDPDRALSGMAEMTLKQRGAYNSILDLLYSRDGDVPDDDRRVAKMITCHWREYAAAKTELVALGKIWVEDGKLRAKRVQETIMEASDFGQDQSKRASDGWQKRKSTNKNNDSPTPPGNALTATPIDTPTPRSIPASVEGNGRKVNRLSEALGFDVTAQPRGFKFLESLVRLEMDGFDLELDILPVIRERRALGGIPADLGGLAYFRKPIEAQRKARDLMAEAEKARAAVVSTLNPKDWLSLLDRFLRDGAWLPRPYSPPPVSEGCLCPPGLLEAARARWNEQGQHPREDFFHDGEPWVKNAVFETPMPFWGDNVVTMPRRSA